MSLCLEVAYELALMRRTVGQTFNVRPSTKEGIEFYVGGAFVSSGLPL
jgi:hypothetical protein